MTETILTGASGFLGKHLYWELVKEHNVTTISRKNAIINVDLITEIPNLSQVSLIVHCAGKAHSVPKTEAESRAFFDVNLTGTKNLLHGIEKCGALPKAFVFISTVAVYGCDTGLQIKETHPLNAQDPYGLSKIQAEQLVQNWCKQNDVICSILRLPLLVGENPPGNLGAMIMGIKRGYYFNIAGGSSKKSMVMASDVAKIITIVAGIGGVYNLTDGYHPSFSELALSISNQLHRRKPFSLPYELAKLIAKTGDVLWPGFPITSNKLNKITSDLTFDDSKARRDLNWDPKPVIGSFKV